MQRNDYRSMLLRQRGCDIMSMEQFIDQFMEEHDISFANLVDRLGYAHEGLIKQNLSAKTIEKLKKALC